MLELVTFNAPNRELLATCLHSLKERSYIQVDQLKGLREFTVIRKPDSSIEVGWYERGKAQSLTSRKDAIRNRKLRRQLVASLISKNQSIPSYEEVEQHLLAHGVEPISRQLLYKQIADLIGRKTKGVSRLQILTYPHRKNIPPLEIKVYPPAKKTTPAL